MFKRRFPNAGSMSISIIEGDPQADLIMAQDMLLAGLRDVAMGVPDQLLNHTLEEYLQPPEENNLLGSDVEHPSHYRKDSGLEAIDAIEAWDLNFNLGNVVKYICRAGLKGDTDGIEDLEKALWYIQRELKSRATNLELYPPKKDQY